MCRAEYQAKKQSSLTVHDRPLTKQSCYQLKELKWKTTSAEEFESLLRQWKGSTGPC
ncbi:hypothetical protein BABINDRAFT_160703 [Babjeviella inositovora NRRL Y-12698]|uniref:Uncharacterized protein n=1 Tax=Babjeviella inositovora NRRL Y-12698 TaxID=984486 RepID=A0A1E3QUH7_9ASCO|nr:uncharacterized protein BABINDRAFT_160703 [Babjeviella inositovora NRRL Y-12698]ODQ81345.1 hypothetical protein BABINDRAFT_160703 [Babjeviella inositovora NRRL Y-12698]